MTIHPSRVDVSSELQAAWMKVLEGKNPGWQPVWFDESRGLLVVYCINSAWQTTLRLLTTEIIEKLNAELPEPRVQQLVATLWEAHVLVTGSRSWTDEQAIADALTDAWHDVTQTISPQARMVVVHGDCPSGADAIAKQWAIDNGCIAEPHPADWSAPCADICPPNHRKTSRQHGDYCPWAGHRRNQLMVDLGADLVLAFLRNNSRGTTDCINRAKRAGIPVRILEDSHG